MSDQERDLLRAAVKAQTDQHTAAIFDGEAWDAVLHAQDAAALALDFLKARGVPASAAAATVAGAVVGRLAREIENG